MSPGWRTLLVCGGVLAVANLALAAAVAGLHPLLRRAVQAWPAAARARAWWAARLVPPAGAALVAAAAAIAFARHEPIRAHEPVSALLLALAAVGGLGVVLTATRLGAALFAAERLASRWTGGAASRILRGTRAWVVDVPFPLAAVVGVRRPRLVIARRVIEACSQYELAAILAHERAHVETHDNLRAVCLDAVADGLGLFRASTRLRREWQEAAEEAADDVAVRTEAAADLAGALVTVARLVARTRPRAWAAIPCFYRGDRIERRVRRLLASSGAVPAARRRPRATTAARIAARATAVAAGGAAFAALASSRVLYALGEWFVQGLP